MSIVPQIKKRKRNGFSIKGSLRPQPMVNSFWHLVPFSKSVNIISNYTFISSPNYVMSLIKLKAPHIQELQLFCSFLAHNWVLSEKRVEEVKSNYFLLLILALCSCMESTHSFIMLSGWSRKDF